MKDIFRVIIIGIFVTVVLCILLNAMGAFSPFSAEKQYWKAYRFCVERSSYQITTQDNGKDAESVQKMIEACNNIQKP